MEPYHRDFDTTYFVGNVLDVAAAMAARSVHVVVTSPPYWALRDYGIKPSVWGGDPDCAHVWGPKIRTPWANDVPGPSENVGKNKRGHWTPKETGPVCTLCDAWLGVLGLEPIHDCLGWATGTECSVCYICHMRTVAAAIWRVLRDDGVMLINIGDSYAGSGKGPTGTTGIGDAEKRQGFVGGNHPHLDSYYGKRSENKGGKRTPTGLKAKDRVGIPERLALALQRDGWTWRDTVHLCKTSPMPESVRDRTTQAHEPLFMFTKRARYFWDVEAVKEETSETTHSRGPAYHDMPKTTEAGSGNRMNQRFAAASWGKVEKRNPRSWMIWANEPSKVKHYARFPRFIPSFAIRGGSSEHGVCSKCSAPWTRILVPSDAYAKHLGQDWADHEKDAAEGRGHSVSEQRPIKRITRKGANAVNAEYVTVGWRPTCKHLDAPVVPATIWDPFSGSGTSCRVARELGRHSIFTDLSPKYADMAIRLQEKVTPMLPRMTAPAESIAEQLSLNAAG